MPRLMSGSCPTCVSSPVFCSLTLSDAGCAVVEASASSVPSDTPAAGCASESATRAASTRVQSTVQSANDSAIGADVSVAALAQSAGCARAEPGDSASAASAIAAAHTGRTVRWAMRPSPCRGGALPRRLLPYRYPAAVRAYRSFAVVEVGPTVVLSSRSLSLRLVRHTRGGDLRKEARSACGGEAGRQVLGTIRSDDEGVRDAHRQAHEVAGRRVDLRDDD